jgi:sulfur carrier protein ThiS
MKTTVRLYGTLGRLSPGYDHSAGIEVEIPDGATVKDLLARLEIPESAGAVVVREGRILKADDKMRSGVPVNVVQAVRGG